MGILNDIMGPRPNPTGMTPQEQVQKVAGSRMMPAPITRGNPSFVAGRDAVPPQMAPPTANAGPSFGQKISNFFSDEDKVAKLILALEPLRGPGGQGGTAARWAQGHLQNSRETNLLNQQSNKTIEFLRAKGVDPKLLESARGNPSILKALVAKTLESPAKPSAFAEKLAAAKQAYPNLSDAELMDKVLAPSSQTTIDLGDAESAFQKEAGKGQAQFINNLAEGLPAAAALETSVNRLMALSEAVESGGLSNIPTVMRRLIPQGVEPTFDAYTSQMLGVAQGLREKGTGAQSERDMDLLIARSGSIGSDVRARRIAHQALREKAAIDREMGRIARQIQLHSSDSQKVQELQAQLDELLMRPAITPEMQSYLNGLTPDFTLDEINAELERRGN